MTTNIRELRKSTPQEVVDSEFYYYNEETKKSILKGLEILEAAGFPMFEYLSAALGWIFIDHRSWDSSQIQEVNGNTEFTAEAIRLIYELEHPNDWLSITEKKMGKYAKQIKTLATILAKLQPLNTPHTEHHTKGRITVKSNHMQTAKNFYMRAEMRIEALQSETAF